MRILPFKSTIAASSQQTKAFNRSRISSLVVSHLMKFPQPKPYS